jgi:hypothetical protein
MGLHRGAIGRRLAIARRRGRLHAVSIASPSNTASLCNLLRQGGRVEGILDLPDGRVRYLIGFADDRRTPRDPPRWFRSRGRSRRAPAFLGRNLFEMRSCSSTGERTSPPGAEDGGER